MSEASYASLGPTLLARKGGAKPAMRPQLAPLPANSAEIAALADEQLEDLGWNDMGGDDADPAVSEYPLASPENDLIVEPLRGADVVSITSRSAAPAAANEDTLIGGSPVVLRQQKRLAIEIPQEFGGVLPGSENHDHDCASYDEADQLLLRKKEGAQTASTTAKTYGRTKKDAASLSGRRAAFTLRLDADRRMKLRLASTMQNTSAQALVTEALDRLLDDFDDLDALVARLRRD